MLMQFGGVHGGMVEQQQWLLPLVGKVEGHRGMH